MAYSNTISQTSFNTDKVLSSAVRRTKVPAEQITAETWVIARDNLFLILSALANEGVPLWCILKVIMPLYEGTVDVTLPLGTVDVLNANLRTLSTVTGTNTDTSTTRSIAFTDATAVSTVGILWSAAAVAIALERSTDGSTWTTIQSETPSAASGEWTWFDLETVVSAAYFRVRATTGTLGFTTITTGNNPTEIPISRLSRDSYTSLPDKTFQSGRVVQYWFDRQVKYPVMRLWPSPNSSVPATQQLVIWCHRNIMDVGTLTQELEVPQRWYMAIVTALASQMAREMIEVDPKVIPMLDNDAALALRSVQAEERDNSPIVWQPNIAMYTR